MHTQKGWHHYQKGNVDHEKTTILCVKKHPKNMVRVLFYDEKHPRNMWIWGVFLDAKNDKPKLSSKMHFYDENIQKKDAFFVKISIPK